MRARLSGAAIPLWGFGLALALQKGWLDAFPNWGVIALLLAPTVVFGYLFLTSEPVTKFLRNTNRMMSLFLFIVIGGGIGGASWFVLTKVRPQRDTPASNSPAFSVRMGWGSHFGDKTNLWFVLINTKTPIWGAQLITFTNLLPHPILIESYKVEQKVKDGPWETISIPFDLTRGKIYMGDSETVDAREMKYVTFDEVIQDKNIASNESIRGWLLFNLQRRGLVRMTVDTPEGSYTEDMQGSAHKNWPIQSMLTDAVPGVPRIDLGKIRLSDFAHPDPIPFPTPRPSSTPSKVASPPSPAS